MAELASAREAADELVETFELFDEWEDRYRFIIDLGRKLPPMEEGDKNETTRVRGCQSNVWMVAHARSEGNQRVIDFLADSDAAIVKGLIAILRRVYSGRPADEILAFDAEGLFERLDFGQHLTMGRRNGLFGMVQRIKALAGASTVGASAAAGGEG